MFGHVREGRGTEWMLFNRLPNAYERTVAARGGIGNLLLTAWELAKACFPAGCGSKTLTCEPIHRWGVAG